MMLMHLNIYLTENGINILFNLIYEEILNEKVFSKMHQIIYIPEFANEDWNSFFQKRQHLGPYHENILQVHS